MSRGSGAREGQPPPPPQHHHVRNFDWTHLRAGDVITQDRSETAIELEQVLAACWLSFFCGIFSLRAALAGQVGPRRSRRV